MLIQEQRVLEAEIVALADRHGRKRSALLPILLAIQEKYHYINKFAMQEVAALLGIHPVEVYGVVRFYSFLHAERRGNVMIRMCRSLSCDLAGKDAVARQIENDLGIQFGETTEDGRFSLEWAQCLGQCDRGPALLVGDTLHPRVRCAEIHEILEQARAAFGVYPLRHAGVAHTPHFHYDPMAGRTP